MASTISAGTTTTTSLSFSGDTSGVLQLQTNGTTAALTIDTSQNVGVGVTPYASWSSFGKAVQLGSTGVFAVASGGSNTNLADNWQTNGSADYYITTNYATRYKQTSGQHQWFVAPSGTAGNAITFTQAMQINNSGYVTKPTQPAFFAQVNGAQSYSTGWQQVVLVNFSSGYQFGTSFINYSTNYFTAPVAGKYFFSAAITFSSGSNTDGTIGFNVNGGASPLSGRSQAYNISNGENGMDITHVLNLNAGDTVGVQFYGFTTTVTRNTQYAGYFSGYLLG
jgi:hypothetical protein